MAKLDATDEEVMEAAKAAYVHRFVQTLSHGYDTELNEEATTFPRAEAAFDDRKGNFCRPEDTHSRRGHQLCRYPDRGTYSKGYG